jgi:hypothetical protein
MSDSSVSSPNTESIEITKVVPAKQPLLKKTDFSSSEDELKIIPKST